MPDFNIAAKQFRLAANLPIFRLNDHLMGVATILSDIQRSIDGRSNGIDGLGVRLDALLPSYPTISETARRALTLSLRPMNAAASLATSCQRLSLACQLWLSSLLWLNSDVSLASQLIHPFVSTSNQPIPDFPSTCDRFQHLHGKSFILISLCFKS
jgi:hypothetical protein